MDLVERYVYAVGRRLPARQRADIELELKSLIQDSLDARTGGAAATEADAVAVLKELGHPAKVAANYSQAGRYLIGPRLFEIYRIVLPIVVAAAAFGLVMAFIVESAALAGVTDVARLISKLISNLIDGCISAVGSVTIIFAIIERLMPEGTLLTGPVRDWDPRGLPPVVPARQRVKLSEPILGLVFTALAMILFNLYPQALVLHFATSGVWQPVPLFDPGALGVYLPLWNVSWALTLIWSGLLLATGRRTLLLNVFDVLLSVVSLGILAFMQRGPLLISSALTEFGELGHLKGLDTGYRITLAVITVIVIIDAIRKVCATIRSAADAA